MTASQSDFRRALQALDDELKTAPLPRGLVEPPWTKSPSRRPVLYLAATAAIVLVMGAIWVAGPRPSPSPPEVTQVVFSPSHCGPATLTPKIRLAEGCTLRVSYPNLVIRALRDAEIEHTQRGLRVLQGELQFELQPALGAKPLAIMVAAGHIEGLTSRFRVRQDGAGPGSVEVLAGPIVFVGSDTARTVLSTKARHKWLSEEPELPPAQWSKARIDREVAAASRARAEGEYEAARQRLTKLLKAPVGERVAEIMSFELGGLLERKIKDAEAACVHWRGHRGRFVGGRYAEQVQQRLNACRLGNFDEPGE